MATSSNNLLAPLSALYSALTRTRLALYRTGILRTQTIDFPVISVGNITTGGTGKTPFVLWLARQLAQDGQRVCILSRGYGRSDSAKQVLVSNGRQVMAGVTDAGDEPRLLAEQLVGKAAVISNADRVSAAKWAIEHLDSNLFILDDAFQHLAIARNLNVVTVDATNPWGGRFLLPRGRLREPMEGLARADLIVLTRADCASDIETLRAEAEQLSKGRPIILSETRTIRVVPLAAEREAENGNVAIEVPAQPVLAFCAVGNPSSFFAHVSRDGHKLVSTETFRDHHVYTQNDVDELALKAKTHGAQSMVTTAKDAVKLRGLRFDVPCYVIEIETIFDDEKRLLEIIREAVHKTSRQPAD